MGALLMVLPLAARAAAVGASGAVPVTAGPVALDFSHRDLLLEVWVNGSNRHAVAPVEQRGASLWIAGTLLQGLGIRPGVPASGRSRIDLSAEAGIQAQVDEAHQRLLLRVKPGRLATRVIDLSNPDSPALQARSGRGVVFNYDMSATRVTGQRGIDGGAALSATVFAPQWRFVSAGFTRVQDRRTESVRLDSAVVLDRPGQLRQWIIGDTVSGGLDWSRSVRFGGVHVGTDYSLQPQLRTFPMPDFAGSVTVPSSVDVYVNRARVMSEDLATGPFELRDLPIVTGRGEATVVVRDVLGREQVQTVPFFASSLMLRPGLDDYSVDVGAMRRAYGEHSFDYGRPMASATFRRGVDEGLTVQGHAEFARGVALAGGGAAFALQPVGIVQVNAAASRGSGTDGHLLALSSTTQFSAWNLFGTFTVSSPRYRDIGSIYDAAPAHRRLQAGASVALSRRDDIAFSWTDVRYPDVHARLLGASYSRSFGNGMYLGASALVDRNEHAWQAQIFVSVPLGESRSASFSLGRDDGRTTGRASLMQSADPDGGVGYRVSGGHDPIRFAEGYATWIGSHAVVDGGLSDVGGEQAFRLGARGSLAWMGGAGEVFAARSIDDAFAVVRTGRAHASIYQENRKVATADADGLALLPGLVAYADNRISLDPHDYPMSVMLDHVEREVVPRRGSGVVVDMQPRVTRPALLTVRLANGAYPPVGAQVMLVGRRKATVVGRRGKVFLPTSNGPISGRITYHGGACTFHSGPLPDRIRGRIMQIGPLTCQDETLHAR